MIWVIPLQPFCLSLSSIQTFLRVAYTIDSLTINYIALNFWAKNHGTHLKNLPHSPLWLRCRIFSNTTMSTKLRKGFQNLLNMVWEVLQTMDVWQTSTANPNIPPHQINRFEWLPMLLLVVAILMSDRQYLASSTWNGWAIWLLRSEQHSKPIPNQVFCLH